MKKLNLLALVLVTLCFLFTADSNAQRQGQSVVGVSVGQSLVGGLINSAGDALDGNGSVDASNNPVFQVTYDYGLADKFSIGAAFAIQRFKLDYSDYSFTDLDGMMQTVNFDAASSRTSFAVRPLFHYGNGDKLDMYSGLRVQYVLWSGSNDSPDPNFEVDTFSGGRFGVGLVLFGFRYYVTDMIGLSGEIQIGAPYVSAFGVSARFGGESASTSSRGGSRSSSSRKKSSSSRKRR